MNTLISRLKSFLAKQQMKVLVKHLNGLRAKANTYSSSSNMSAIPLKNNVVKVLDEMKEANNKGTSNDSI